MNDSSGRIVAFGDVHGSTLQLDALWYAITPTPADTFVFLGDYVDRGPDSKGVLDRLIEWSKAFRLVCLRGNHELMMVRSREDNEERKGWLNFGGAESLASYSPRPGRMGKLDDVPESHWDFLENGLVDYYETNRVVFAHAGLDPAKPLDGQTEVSLFWLPLGGPIELASGKVVVCGHTAQKSGTVLDLGSTVCIDTCVYGTGTLTCLDVTAWHGWRADLLGRVTEFDLPGR
jgi:serine/threonine protein phosphatase 1